MYTSWKNMLSRPSFPIIVDSITLDDCDATTRVVGLTLQFHLMTNKSNINRIVCMPIWFDACETVDLVKFHWFRVMSHSFDSPKEKIKYWFWTFELKNIHTEKMLIKLLFTSFTQGQSQAINTLLCELMNGFDDKPGLTKKIVSICLWKLIKIYWLKALMFASFRSFICFHSPATICHRWIVPKMFSMRLIPMNDSN